jgi:pumilio family protein 6
MAIAKELEGRYIELSKAKYGKFLVGKILEYGYVLVCPKLNMRNAEVRNLVVKEFLGNVNRLITHKEAGAVLNDIYRDIATPGQRIEILQELYGPEFRLFKVFSSLSGTNGRARKGCHCSKFSRRSRRRKN